MPLALAVMLPVGHLPDLGDQVHAYLRLEDLRAEMRWDLDAIDAGKVDLATGVTELAGVTREMVRVLEEGRL